MALWYGALAIWGMLVLRSHLQQWRRVGPLPHSEFLHALEKREVKALT